MNSHKKLVELNEPKRTFDFEGVCDGCDNHTPHVYIETVELPLTAICSCSTGQFDGDNHEVWLYSQRDTDCEHPLVCVARTTCANQSTLLAQALTAFLNTPTGEAEAISYVQHVYKEHRTPEQQAVAKVASVAGAKK